MSPNEAPCSDSALCFDAHIISIKTYRSFDDVPGLVWRAIEGVINTDDKDQFSQVCDRIAGIFGVDTGKIREKLLQYPALPRQSLNNRFETLVRHSNLTRSKLVVKILHLNKLLYD